MEVAGPSADEVRRLRQMCIHSRSQHDALVEPFLDSFRDLLLRISLPKGGQREGQDDIALAAAPSRPSPYPKQFHRDLAEVTDRIMAADSAVLGWNFSMLLAPLLAHLQSQRLVDSLARPDGCLPGDLRVLEGISRALATLIRRAGVLGSICQQMGDEGMHPHAEAGGAGGADRRLKMLGIVVPHVARCLENASVQKDEACVLALIDLADAVNATLAGCLSSLGKAEADGLVMARERVPGGTTSAPPTPPPPRPPSPVAIFGVWTGIFISHSLAIFATLPTRAVRLQICQALQRIPALFDDGGGRGGGKNEAGAATAVPPGAAYEALCNLFPSVATHLSGYLRSAGHVESTSPLVAAANALTSWIDAVLRDDRVRPFAADAAGRACHDGMAVDELREVMRGWAAVGRRGEVGGGGEEGGKTRKEDGTLLLGPAWVRETSENVMERVEVRQADGRATNDI